MTWFGYVFIGVLVLNAAVSVGTIGRPREALTPDAAVVVLVINGLLIWGAITVGTVHP